MKTKHLYIEKNTNNLKIICQKDWIIYETDKISKEFKTIKKELSNIKSAIFDFSEVQEFDSAGIILLIDFKHILNDDGINIDITGFNEKQKKMVALIEAGYSTQELPDRYENPLQKIGKTVLEQYKLFKDFLEFVGQMSIAFFRLLYKPSLFRFKETAYHIEKSGLNAMFIIALTSLLVGLVVSYQSLVQLAKFGADIFVVDATGIAVTRELGPMLTAIVIAGRSASSYAAEIGTMKITEEISAMRTMGFDPYYFLVIPRIVALVIAMPLLIFFSDIVGIFGGMVAAKMQVGISFDFYIKRLQEVLEVKQYILGMIKGPFFALIIASTGCFHGFRVTRDTESIGIETTSSVVHAIFFVIACDALFSIIYTQLGF